MRNYLDYIGNWPVDTEDARKEKRFLHITPEKTLRLIHGSGNQIGVNFFISNSRVHLGTISLNGGKYSDYEKHAGDEAILVLKGTVQIVVSKDPPDADSVSTVSYEVNEGENFLIPEGYYHRYHNLAVGMSKLLFTVAPNY
ncbi:MAG: cupin domain-containing protein [Actinobacteria bacterium]|nr:cupin domain-containing protein [Actinomycetota bacterium]